MSACRIILHIHQQRWAHLSEMVVMAGANESGHSRSPTCHLSPIIGHESLQTFEGSQHHKTTPSWKDTHWSLPERGFFFPFFYLRVWICVRILAAFAALCACLCVCVSASLPAKCVENTSCRVCCVSPWCVFVHVYFCTNAPALLQLTSRWMLAVTPAWLCSCQMRRGHRESAQTLINLNHCPTFFWLRPWRPISI